MATKVIMPVLGLTMESGVIVEWMKQEGEQITEGEILFTVETDKSVMEVEAKVSGEVLKLLYGPGDSIPIQEIIGYIGSPGEAAPTTEGPAPPEAPPEVETSSVPKSMPAVLPTRSDGRIKSSPAARKRAQALGISIEEITGTGPGGRIVRADVEAFTASRIPAPTSTPVSGATKRELSRTPLTGIRKIAATRLTESTTTVPHFYLTMDIDMTRAVELREAFLARGEAEGLPRVSFNDILIKAVGIALRESPAMNASLDGDTIVQYADVHIGFAVALEDGLVVPVVSQADQRSIFDIAKITQELDARAKAQGLTPNDYGYGTFTVSNLGMFGVDQFTAIINPPEAAILAVGGIKKRPVVIDETVEIRSMMTITLSSDHRIIDGAIAARFLARLRRILEQPLELLIQT